MEQRGGGGNQESAAMLAQVRQFFELHGNARFTDWDRATDDHAPKTVNRAGFRRTDGESGDIEYYVLREVFRAEICKGLDYDRLCTNVQWASLSNKYKMKCRNIVYRAGQLVILPTLE